MFSKKNNGYINQQLFKRNITKFKTLQIPLRLVFALIAEYVSGLVVESVLKMLALISETVYGFVKHMPFS